MPYSFVDDRSRLSGQTNRIIDAFPSGLPDQIFEMVTIDIPGLFFAPVSERASLIYIPFALALALALYHGLRRREAGLVFVAMACVATFVFLALIPFGTGRLVIYVVPLMYMLILMSRSLRPIGYMFAVLAVSSSLVSFATGFDRAPESRLWLYLNEQGISLAEEDPLLISEYSRHPYFFLQARKLARELRWDDVTSRENVFIVGTGEFVIEQIEEVERLARSTNSVFRRRDLTPDYHDEDGNTLVQLYDFRTDG